MKPSALILLLWFGLVFPPEVGNAKGPVAPFPTTDAQADALVKENLPPESQHVFIPIDPSWKTAVAYMKPVTNAFENVDHPSQEQKRKLYRDVRYFTGGAGSTTLDDPVKIVDYYPGGSIYREIDYIKDDQFCRSFFPDRLLREYTHWRKGKWIAALAVFHATRKISFFSNGSGCLATGGETPEECQIDEYQDGDQFLHEIYRNSVLSELTLMSGCDSLHVSPEGEELLLPSIAESWQRPTGKAPSVFIMSGAVGPDGKTMPVPTKTDIRQLEPVISERPSEDLKETQIKEEWKIAYPKRRKEFLDRFGLIIAKSGNTWKDIGIEFVRDDKPWHH